MRHWRRVAAHSHPSRVCLALTTRAVHSPVLAKTPFADDPLRLGRPTTHTAVFCRHVLPPDGAVPEPGDRARLRRAVHNLWGNTDSATKKRNGTRQNLSGARRLVTASSAALATSRTYPSSTDRSTARRPLPLRKPAARRTVGPTPAPLPIHSPVGGGLAAVVARVAWTLATGAGGAAGGSPPPRSRLWAAAGRGGLVAPGGGGRRQSVCFLQPQHGDCGRRRPSGWRNLAAVGGGGLAAAGSGSLARSKAWQPGGPRPRAAMLAGALWPGYPSLAAGTTPLPRRL